MQAQTRQRTEDGGSVVSTPTDRPRLGDTRVGVSFPTALIKGSYWTCCSFTSFTLGAVRVSDGDAGDPTRQFQNVSGALTVKARPGCLGGEEVEAVGANFFESLGFENKGRCRKVRWSGVPQTQVAAFSP